MGPLSRIAQFKAIETNMLASPTDPIGTLDQLRYGTTRIAYSAAAAQSGLFALPGSTYRDPELSWRYSIIPSGLGFLTGNGLGSIYAGTLWSGEGSTKAITGGSTGAFTGGALLLLRLTPDRLHLDLSSDSRLADHVADNGVAYPPPFGTSAGAAGYKFDGRESETLLVGQGFGVITDIQSGPDGCLYVTSGSSGTVYKIRLAP